MRRSIIALALVGSVSFASRASAQHLEHHQALTPPDDGVRISAEVGASLGTLLVGALVGGLVGYASGSQDCEPYEWLCGRDFGAIAGTSIGLGAAAVLAPLAISAVAGLTGGEGGTGGAYLGLLVGAASGAATIALGVGLANAIGWSGDGVADALVWSSAIIGPLLVVAGPIVGYEVSHGIGRRRSIDVTPTLGADANGFVLGASGHF